MKLFTCTNCGHPVYFENTFCINCGAQLGFNADLLQPAALTTEDEGQYSVQTPEGKIFYKYCSNHQYNVCNWLVPANSGKYFCAACSLNRTIPDLGRQEYLFRWRTIENAKHRLVYQLMRMKMPVINKMQDESKGLVFDFMADDNSEQKILTGHDNGVITVNISEADDVEREMARKHMHEVYRTLLGHFRHETGHYYWDRFIKGTVNIEAFRKLFGDERLDYAAALVKHYSQGAPANWSQDFISAYATMHPWEDWAETWAHYMHIIDTLETAYSYGMSMHPHVSKGSMHAEIKNDPYTVKDFEEIFQQWLPLTFAMNSLNRSMGLRDIYPFVISAPAKEKLKFIHRIVVKG